MNPGVLKQMIEETGIRSTPGETHCNAGVGFGLPDPEDYLAAHVKDWVRFAVSGRAKYLGFWVGPAAGEALWGEAMTKWAQRASWIGVVA